MLLLIAMLALSNVFMTVAWFAHLRFDSMSLWQAILASWLIALFEYMIAVPAVRLASENGIDPATIKITQQAMAFLVFALVIGLLVTQTGLGWRFLASAVVIAAA